MERSIIFYIFNLIGTFLFISFSCNSYAGCQWSSQDDLDNDINRATNLLNLYRDCLDNCLDIKDRYDELSIKLGYFDPCPEDFLTKEHINKIREISVAFKNEELSKNNPKLENVVNEWPNSEEKLINNNCKFKVFDNIPKGCWCSGPEAKTVNNTQQSNGKQGGNEQDGIRIKLMNPIFSESIEHKECSFNGFVDKNTYFSKKVSTCFDPECGGNYQKVRVYVYEPVN